MGKPKKGSTVVLPIYGHPLPVEVLKVWPFGTVDVRRADGACFRITGLAWESQ